MKCGEKIESFFWDFFQYTQNEFSSSTVISSELSSTFSTALGSNGSGLRFVLTHPLDVQFRKKLPENVIPRWQVSQKKIQLQFNSLRGKRLLRSFWDAIDSLGACTWKPSAKLVTPIIPNFTFLIKIYIKKENQLVNTQVSLTRILPFAH